MTPSTSLPQPVDAGDRRGGLPLDEHREEHMRHIYEKLGVHKGAEAVQLARELGLLGPSARTGR